VVQRTDAPPPAADACACEEGGHVSAASVAKADPHHRGLILIAADDADTRDGIEALLTADGYRVDAARSEDDAIDHARRERPDLILVTLGGRPAEVVGSAVRIRLRAALSREVPVVVFCVPTIDEGAEVAVGHRIYVTRPDNFDQLRAFLGRVLRESRRRPRRKTSARARP
jgi:DNA-binding response OmpR family regulator